MRNENGMRIAVLVLLAGVLPAQEKSQGYQPLRRPLFGLTIEHDAAEGAHRLVRHRGTAREELLITGKRDACETYMIDLLERRFGRGKFNVKLPTLGGKQFWADEFVLAGWRIQKNHFSDHFRLLDPRNVRLAWGSWEACRVALEKQRFQRRLKIASPHVVMLVHGMGRSRKCFEKLAKLLREDGYEVVAVSYPSTRRTIEEHAAQLARVLERTEGATKVSFVTHSMGGLVVRVLLGKRKQPWMTRVQPHRLVMLGVPNRGSVLADKLKDVLPFKVIAGEGGQDLVTKRIAKMPRPSCEFGVIAGGIGGAKGLNPMIEGDNDGLVAVENAKLAGMADFLLVRSLHTVLMDHPEAVAAVRRFLKEGRFRHPGQGTKR